MCLLYIYKTQTQMNISSAVYAFVLGSLVALVVIVAHIIVTAVKHEYHDVGQHGRAIESRDPRAYALLYRAKQHAIRCRKIDPGKGIRGKLLALYASFQPDSRYLRLERNLAKLTDPTVRVGDDKRRVLILRCRKDLTFLDNEPRPPRRHNLIVGMLLGLVHRVLIPQREGVTEPSLPEARAEVKMGLTQVLDAYE